MNTADLIHGALLDAAGTCVAQGVFPLCSVPSFTVNATETGYETDFAVIAEEVFGIHRDDIAKAICENIIQCCELEITGTEIKDGLIILYVK